MPVLGRLLVIILVCSLSVLSWPWRVSQSSPLLQVRGDN